ncbi:alpha/beta hydrolase [Dyadobacter luticola]|uniref:Alpha/beta hydrolase n=1 Tax=Dyadobacter luticola TaxID=1979387 RepID=A0A5R9L2E5_9BACT|nr:alpha/beta hydrolase-fold protein [Dyadobacter luticola]TLV02752.1 alpha/beta hydrolase [Dyadobacter luticola]
MKYFLSAFLLFISALASAQTPIQIGHIDTIQSKILNQTREIMVHVPDGGDGQYSRKRYPVIYLLDGESHFNSVVGMVQQLSSVNGNMVVPQMIVVGIRNRNRRRDMTPNQASVDPPFMDSAAVRQTGGGNAFLDFIEKELMPQMDSLYPTAPYKMLIGHSLGGLVVMNALITRPRLFNSYICIEPSMWFDHAKFLETTKKALSETKYNGVSLYMGIANTLSEGITLANVAKDTGAFSRHIRSIVDLDKYIKANPQIGLRYKSKFYAEDTHSSAPLITEYDGLRFIFDFYNLKFSDSDFEKDGIAFPQKIVKHYNTISRQMGYPVLPPEEMVNSLGYQAMQEKHDVMADAFFKLNAINYPGSWNVYDSYGDFFASRKNKAAAIAQYEKSLAIEDHPETREKLEALKK